MKKTDLFRATGELIGGAAIYGYAIGSVHSPLFAQRNLIKFPLLILLTSLICALSYYIIARFVTDKLTFPEVQKLVLGLYRRAALLLASLGTIVFFLALTVIKPTEDNLGEYPLFLGLNTLFIAICGSLALIRQSQELLYKHELSRRITSLLILSWLMLSLLTGSQCAWYLRPFCGVSTHKAEEVPFILGNAPDYRGASNFYEAVWHLLDPPSLPEDYMNRGKGD